MIDSCKANYKDGVVECLANGVDVHYSNDYFVRLICKKGHFELLPLLFDHAETKETPFDLNALVNSESRYMDEENVGKFTDCIVGYSVGKNIEKVKEEMIASVSCENVRFDEANDKNDEAETEWVKSEEPPKPENIDVIPYEPKVYTSIWSTSPIKVEEQIIVPHGVTINEGIDIEAENKKVYYVDEVVKSVKIDPIPTIRIGSSNPKFNFSNATIEPDTNLRGIATVIPKIEKLELQDDCKNETLLQKFGDVGQELNGSIKNLTNILNNDKEVNELVKNITNYLNNNGDFQTAVNNFAITLEQNEEFQKVASSLSNAIDKGVKFDDIKIALTNNEEFQNTIKTIAETETKETNNIIISNLKIGDNIIQIGSPQSIEITNDELKPKVEMQVTEDLTKSKYDDYDLEHSSVIHNEGLTCIIGKLKIGINSSKEKGHYSYPLSKYQETFVKDIEEIFGHYGYTIELTKGNYDTKNLLITW